MTTPDRTKLPAKITVPQPPDSDSGRPVTYEGEMREDVRRHRYSAARVLVMGSVLSVAGTVGYDAYDAHSDHQKDTLKTGIAIAEEWPKTEAEADKIPKSQALRIAEIGASARLFGGKNGAADTDAAQKIANTPGTWSRLNIEDYVSPEDAKIDSVNDTFEVEDTDHVLNMVVGEDGKVCVVASQPLYEENKAHLTNSTLVDCGPNAETAGEKARVALKQVLSQK